MELLRPELLKKLIQHDRSVKRAVAMLEGKWGSLFAGQLTLPKIDASTVMIAKRLVQTGLFTSQIDFKNYRSVKKYLLQNDVYLLPSAKQALLRPFRE